MCPGRPMRVTIVARRPLPRPPWPRSPGALVSDPARRLIAAAAGRPVVEIAAGLCHGQGVVEWGRATWLAILAVAVGGVGRAGGGGGTTIGEPCARHVSTSIETHTISATLALSLQESAARRFRSDDSRRRRGQQIPVTIVPQRHLLLHHVAADPHHLRAAEDRVHRIRGAEERLS